MATKKPRTKSIPKKPTGKSCSCNCKILSLILGVIVIGLLIAVAFLVKNQKTYEEEKRLQAFETLANYYIDELSMYSEESREGKIATLTGIGVTDDNDLYFDFIITNYKDHVPVSTQDGRLHFQCDNRSGKVVGTNNPEGCALAYWYGEETETPLEFQETYRKYIEDSESAVNLCNESAVEDESGNISYSAECEAKREEINKKYADFLKEIEKTLKPHK